MIISPEYVYDFETNLQAIMVDEWARIMPDLFWDQFMKVRTSSTKKELIEWMLTTAGIYAQDDGGQIRFDDLVSISHEITNANFGAGLMLSRNDIEDNSIDRAGQWAQHIGSAGAYWPQKKMFELILAGESALGYDGVAFFSASHPVNPFNTALGNYSNLIAAKPIDSSVTLAVASDNLASVVATIKQIKMPNGEYRHLKTKKLMGPPQLEKRMLELTQAQAFGQGGSQTTATADNVLRNYGWDAPHVAHELAGDATSYYVACEDITSDEVGALMFQERKAWQLDSYQGETQVELDRRDEFEWHFKGRNAAAYGHPYLLFKVKAA